MANDAIAYYEPGADLTGHCDTAVTGKRCLKITANKQPASFGLAPTAVGGNIRVAHADAAGRIVGVSAFDTPAGGKVGIKRASKLVIPITAGAAITAFQEVEVGAAGVVVPKAAGVAIGVAIADAANGADCAVSLY